MTLIADIFVTTKGRPELFHRSISSLLENTPREQFRLTLVNDTGISPPSHKKDFLPVETFDHILAHRENMGLGPSINQALAHIDVLNRWYQDPQAGDPSSVAPFICYCQDDLLYTKGWLQILATRFMAFEKQFNLGFASGIESIEHQEDRKDLPGGMQLKRYIRAANMFSRRETWMSMFPIPRFDPETGRVRAKPNDGMGSGVDWHFMRNHPLSVERTGKTCLVIPGLLQHMGYDQSTWLKRELPESDSDKAIIQGSK